MNNPSFTRLFGLSIPALAFVLFAFVPAPPASGPMPDVSGADLVDLADAPAADIVDLAAEGGFNTLVAAVKAAGLVETLKSEGPFTVFAPTDAAFAKLPEGTLEHLLKPENRDELVGILTYHVVPGRVASGDVVALDEAMTVQGSAVDIEVDGSTVKVNGATVTSVDLEASNGIVHVIDAVLLPPSGH